MDERPVNGCVVPNARVVRTFAGRFCPSWAFVPRAISLSKWPRKSSLKPQGSRKLAGVHTVQLAFWIERFAMWPVKLLALAITTLLAALPRPALKPEAECSEAIGGCNLFRYFAVNRPMLSQDGVLALTDRRE